MTRTPTPRVKDTPRISDLRAQLDRRPGDLRARKQLGDALKDAGRIDDAVEQFQAVVGGYAAQGLLFRAIAAAKSILAIVPDHEETTRVLAELYAKRASGKESAELSPPMSRALMSDEGDPVSLPDHDVVLVPPPLPADAAVDSSDDDAVDVVDANAIAAALTPLAEGAVRLERPPAVPLFSGLSMASFQALVKKLSAWEAEPGALIIGEGEESDSVFVVVRGKVKVEKNGEVLATLSRDSFFGEMALLSKRPRVANVVAVERTELLEMRRDVLEELVANDPGVAAALDAFSRARLLENLARTSPVLRELPVESAKNALSQFTSKRAKAGEHLLDENAPAAGLFVVLSGSLDVLHTSELGPVRIKQLGPGDVFGEMSLLSGHDASASVVAASDCALLVLDKEAFADVARAHPALTDKLHGLAKQRAAHIAQFLPDETSSAVLV